MELIAYYGHLCVSGTTGWFMNYAARPSLTALSSRGSPIYSVGACARAVALTPVILVRARDDVFGTHVVFTIF